MGAPVPLHKGLEKLMKLPPHFLVGVITISEFLHLLVSSFLSIPA